MNDSIEDLIGEPTPKPKKMDLRLTEVHTVTGGVSVPWLCKVFRMGRPKVESLLRDGGVNPIGTYKNGGHYYDLPEAASCLVKPKQDFKAFLRTLKPGDLPLHMQDPFWAAKLKEQKFRLQAGELWPTSAVMQVFGDTFKMIKNKLQLWPDTIVESVGLTDAQRDVLIELNNDLMNQLTEELVKGEKANETRSQLAELEGLDA